VLTEPGGYETSSVIPGKLWEFKTGNTICFRIAHLRAMHGHQKYRDEVVARIKQLCTKGSQSITACSAGPLPGRVPENRKSGLVLYAGGDTFDSALLGKRLQLIAPREHRICTGREFQAQKNHP